MFELAPYLRVQNIALWVLRDVASFIQEGKTERDVVAVCAQLLNRYGVIDSWYYDIPALALVGERTTLSVSGPKYQPSAVAIRADDLVTIDLSPVVDGCWGDCARSYIVESGRVVPPDQSSCLGYGIAAEKELHAMMIEIATPSTSLHDLYTAMNQAIEDRGYRNLDFRGNLGHSIEKHLNDRRYIEANNHEKLGDCELFTFEPHICGTDDIWGFKRENIYYFEGGRAKPLGSPDLLEAV